MPRVSSYHDGGVSIGPPDMAAVQATPSADDVAAAVQHWLSAANGPDVLYFSVYWDGRLVGQIVLDDIDPTAQSSLVAYHLFQTANRGHGIGTRALRLLQRVVTERTDLQRLVIITSRDNLASQRVAQTCGFVYTGPAREDPVEGVVYQWTRENNMPDPVPPLVTIAWLAQRLDDPQTRVADVRWYLPHLGKNGADEYQAGHIPGAVFLDLDTELAAPRGDGPGRHPLPTAMTFGAAMRRAGVNSDTHVVAYDDGSGTAARLWWLLRYFGHDRVSLLDGGLRAWQAAHLPLEKGTGRIMPPGNLVAHPQPDWVVDKEETLRLARAGAALLDARARERYEGKVEPIDARPGHIPGAQSAPFAENVGPDGRFLDPTQLKAKFGALGVEEADTVVAYCGSGVTACHAIFALYLTGRTDVKLYEGSWSDWAADPTLPAASGPTPGEMPKPD